MYVVKLTKPLPVGNSFRDGFFPRLKRFKADANRLVAEVRAEGGEAVVELVAETKHHKPEKST